MFDKFVSKKLELKEVFDIPQEEEKNTFPDDWMKKVQGGASVKVISRPSSTWTGNNSGAWGSKKDISYDFDAIGMTFDSSEDREYIKATLQSLGSWPGAE